jgi:hypothetical protein
VEVTREADLSYHRLVTGFLGGLCERTQAPAYCEYQQRFTDYLATPPAVEVLTRRVRIGRTGRISFELSKISRVSVSVRRGSRTVFSNAATLGYGRRFFPWKPPKRKGIYDVRLAATDLVGNSATVEAQVEVLPKKK